MSNENQRGAGRYIFVYIFVDLVTEVNAQRERDREVGRGRGPLSFSYFFGGRQKVLRNVRSYGDFPTGPEILHVSGVTWRRYKIAA